VKGETSAAEAVHKHGLPVAEIEDWQSACWRPGRMHSARDQGEEALKDEEIERRQQEIGQLVLAFDIRRNAATGGCAGRPGAIPVPTVTATLSRHGEDTEDFSRMVVPVRGLTCLHRER
jgi:hypothetical protein